MPKIMCRDYGFECDFIADGGKYADAKLIFNNKGDLDDG